jgi:hypothetical protein
VTVFVGVGLGVFVGVALGAGVEVGVGVGPGTQGYVEIHCVQLVNDNVLPLAKLYTVVPETYPELKYREQPVYWSVIR